MTLSPLEWIVDFYRALQDAYHWTVREIDGTEICLILEQAIVREKIRNAPRRGYIEDILPL